SATPSGGTKPLFPGGRGWICRMHALKTLGADKLGRELLIYFGQPLWIEAAIGLHFVYRPEIGLVVPRDSPLKAPGRQRADVFDRVRCAARNKDHGARGHCACFALDDERDDALQHEKIFVMVAVQMWWRSISRF